MGAAVSDGARLFLRLCLCLSLRQQVMGAAVSDGARLSPWLSLRLCLCMLVLLFLCGGR